MKPELARLMLGASAFLVGFACSAVLLFRAQQRTKLFDARVDRVVGAYHSSWSTRVPSAYRLSRDLPGVGTLARIGLLLRHDPARQAYYPAKPLVVVLVAAILALLLSRGASLLIGPLSWLALPLGWLLLCRGFYGWCNDRVSGKLYNQFPDALAMIVRSVRVGLPVVEAIRVVARESAEPTSREFTALVDQTAIGVPLEEALREMAERNRLPEYRFFATALSLQSQTGGGLTETLENLADTIRKRVAAKVRGHALAAEARMSSYILGGLPLVAGVMLTIINPGYMSVLFYESAGRKLLVAAAVMLTLGAFSMRVLIRKSLS